MTTETQLYTAEELARDNDWCGAHYAVIDGGYAPYVGATLLNSGRVSLRQPGGRTRTVPGAHPIPTPRRDGRPWGKDNYKGEQG